MILIDFILYWKKLVLPSLVILLVLLFFMVPISKWMGIDINTDEAGNMKHPKLVKINNNRQVINFVNSNSEMNESQTNYTDNNNSENLNSAKDK